MLEFKAGHPQFKDEKSQTQNFRNLLKIMQPVEWQSQACEPRSFRFKTYTMMTAMAPNLLPIGTERNPIGSLMFLELMPLLQK